MTSPNEDSPGSLHRIFLADHRRAEGLLSRLLEAFDADDRTETSRLWTELERVLLVHMETEEEHLLYRLEGPFPVAAAALLRDHLHIRQRLAALGVAIDLHAVHTETVRRFFEELRAHADDEERVLYRWAEQRLDAGETSAVVDGLRERHPRAETSGPGPVDAGKTTTA